MTGLGVARAVAFAGMTVFGLGLAVETNNGEPFQRYLPTPFRFPNHPCLCEDGL